MDALDHICARSPLRSPTKRRWWRAAGCRRACGWSLFSQSERRNSCKRLHASRHKRTMAEGRNGIQMRPNLHLRSLLLLLRRLLFPLRPGRRKAERFHQQKKPSLPHAKKVTRWTAVEQLLLINKLCVRTILCGKMYSYTPRSCSLGVLKTPKRNLIQRVKRRPSLPRYFFLQPFLAVAFPVSSCSSERRWGIHISDTDDKRRVSLKYRGYQPAGQMLKRGGGILNLPVGLREKLHYLWRN